MVAPVFEKPLTKEEFESLRKKVLHKKIGLKKARKLLVEKNLPLVQHITSSFDDDFQEGVFALIKAADKFEFERGLQFTTLAWHSVSRHVYRVRKTKRLDIKSKAYSRVYTKLPLDGNDNINYCLDKNAPQSEFNADDIKSLKDAVGVCLNKREKEIIYMRYYDNSKLSDIGLRYKITKERVRQIIKSALGKLKNHLSETMAL